jgi:hypothetical protein
MRNSILALALVSPALAACSSTVSSSRELRSQGYSETYSSGYEQGCNAGRQARRTDAPTGANGGADYTTGYNKGFVDCRDRQARRDDLGEELARAP